MFGSVFLHANDEHACYNAVELFEVFMTKHIYFVIKFTFLFSSSANIARLEHNNQCCDNVKHPYHLLISSHQIISKFPKFPNIPQNSQYSHKIPNIPGGNLPLSKFPGILHP